LTEDEMIAGIDPYDVPESMTFAHSTRMADSWQALPECILQRAMRVGRGCLKVSTFQGSTADPGANRLPTRNPMKMVRRAQTVDRHGDYIFDTRYEVDSNVGHYIVDTIPKLLVARELISKREGRNVELHAVLKENSSGMSFQAFHAFGIPTIATERKLLGQIVRIEETLPETFVAGRLLHADAPLMVSSLPRLYKDFRATLLPEAGTTPEKVYISRRDSRTVENEEEVARFLEARGFKKYLFETGELSLIEQWRVMAGASHIVAIHGAGLTPLILNSRGLARAPGDRSGLRIVELHGAGYFVDFNRRLAAIANAHWCGVRGRITPEVVRDLDERGGGRIRQSASFRIDLETLELALDYSDRCGDTRASGSKQ
jgi:hypothetical protein